MKNIALTSVICFVLTLGLHGQEFSSDWTTIPKTFTAHDIKKINYALMRSPVLMSKDEFETTDAFEKRRNNLKGIALGDNLTAESLLVFRNEQRLGADEDVAYDADTETLTVKISPKALTYLNMDAKANIDERKFSGVNIGVPEYVVSKPIGSLEKRKLTMYSIAINNWLQFLNGTRTITWELKMPPDTARQAKPNLAFLYVGKLVSPFRGLDVVNVEPSIGRMYYLDGTTWFLICDISEIWMFNKQTGEVYKKVQAKPSH